MFCPDIPCLTAEILKDRLYFTSLEKKPHPDEFPEYYFFTTEKKLFYYNFFEDFGPYNLGSFYCFSQILHKLLYSYSSLSKNKKLVFFSSLDPRCRSNSAFLIGTFCVLYLGFPIKRAFDKLSMMKPPFIPFRDASELPSLYNLTVYNCIEGILKAVRMKLIDLDSFNFDRYVFYDKIENGDFNIIIENKILAFGSPFSQEYKKKLKYQVFSPQQYIPLFQKLGVSTIIRLNKPLYNAKEFIMAGFDHYDIYFYDGSCPSDEIREAFLHIVKNCKGMVAVHCKAGMGRTGTLIGAYLIKEYGFTAAEAISWTRVCRPGSIIGRQQLYLVNYERFIHQKNDDKKSFLPSLIPNSHPNESTPHQAEKLIAKKKEKR